jgi:hypothetical protein
VRRARRRQGTLAGVEPRRRSVVDHDDAMLVLKAIATAFDEHDLDEMLPHFADDAVFEGTWAVVP